MAERETKTEPAFQQTVDADGNVMIECLMGPYRGQHLKVPEAVATAAIADKWAREPNLPPINHDDPAIVMTPEETEHALGHANEAAAFLRGDEGAPVYPPEPPPPEGGARGRKPAEEDDDDDDDTKPARRRR
jgi:hypothetical protein